MRVSKEVRNFIGEQVREIFAKSEVEKNLEVELKEKREQAITCSLKKFNQAVNLKLFFLFVVIANKEHDIGQPGSPKENKEAVRKPPQFVERVIVQQHGIKK